MTDEVNSQEELTADDAEVERINNVADELNREAADVLEYQPIWDTW